MEEFDDYCYNKKDLIGHGAFAIVYKGHCKSKNYDVAIKAIAKKNISKVKNLLNKEIRITKELSDLKHINLVALLKCVESPTHVFLVMEYCNGGDLADYLNTYERINEPTIQHFFSQISKAIEAMNKKNVVHRDLKPQNILLCNPYKLSSTHNVSPKHLIVKLADFGFARELTEGRMAGTLCGSPMYMAPEVIMSHQYSAKADLWSIGTIMYQCLTGKAPFIAQTPQQLKSKYEMAKELYPKIPDFCSVPLSDLLYKLLKKDPKERIEFIDFFLHPFLHVSLNSSTTPFIPQKQHRQESGYSSSTAHIRARFTAPSLNNVESSPLATGNSNNSTPRNSYNLQHGVTPINPIGIVTRYKSPAINNPHLSGITNDTARQAPLRPLHSSPTVQRANFKSSYNGNYSPRHEIEKKKPVSLIKPNLSDGGKPGNISTSQSRCNLQANMLESNDFTFLPPLDKAGGAQKLQPDYFSTRKSQMQFSNSSSTATAILSDNILIDQAHSSKLFDRGEPVPSQRLVYAQMQERRKTSAASPVSHVAVTATSSFGNNNVRCNERRIPSVEELNLPETQFVLHKLPRPNRKNFYGVSSPFNCGAESFLKKSSSIPKSVTCSDLMNPITSNTIASTTGIVTMGISRKFSSPASTKTDDLDNNSQLQTSSEKSKVFDADGISVDNLTIKNLQNNELKNENEENVEPLKMFSLPHDINKEVDNESLISQATDSLIKDDKFLEDDKQLIDGISHLHVQDNNSLKSSANSSKSDKNYKHESIKEETAVTDLLFNTEPPPELEAETILDSEHRQILAKLRFVLELIETLINVAEKKTNLMAMITDSGARKSRHQSSAASDASRRAEQLVLYVRSLHVLSSALVMAQRQINAETLKPSPAVQSVINQLNEKYHQCLTRSQELASLGIPGSDPTMTVVSAERIMYQHAIDLCQSAALDELFGHPQLCPKRYQTAYMMLHTLFEQVQNEQDKSVLAKYKNAVEKRMRILEQQGFVTAVNLNEQTPFDHHHHSHSKSILKEN